MKLVLDGRTIIVFTDPANEKVLLLRRAPTKTLFPNEITGIGGGIEFALDEATDIIGSALRELGEETQISVDTVTDMRWRLSTIRVGKDKNNNDQQVVLFWLTGRLTEMPVSLSCNEGDLEWWGIDQLPVAEMVSTARDAIPFLLQLSGNDNKVYQVIYGLNDELILNN